MSNANETKATETTTVEIEEPGWGIKPSSRGATALASYGARAILKDGFIDLLWDRAGFVGSDEGKEALCLWLNEKALPLLRHLAEKGEGFPYSSESRDVEVCGDGFRLVANPNSSYGYLYIGAWPDATKTEATPKVPKPRKPRAKKVPAKKFKARNSLY